MDTDSCVENMGAQMGHKDDETVARRIQKLIKYVPHLLVQLGCLALLFLFASIFQISRIYSFHSKIVIIIDENLDACFRVDGKSMPIGSRTSELLV